jgi:hypothetical protein
VWYFTNGSSSAAITNATHFQKLVYWGNDHVLTGLKGSKTWTAGICWGLDPKDSTRVMIEPKAIHNNALGQEYGAY